MKATVYLSRKLLNQLKVKETESKDLMLTHNLHNIIINGKRVGCSGHIQNVLNNKCVYVSTEKSCYQPLSDKASMGNTFLDMDETKTATKAQVNTIFVYISKFNRYDMNISKVMVD